VVDVVEPAGRNVPIRTLVAVSTPEEVVPVTATLSPLVTFEKLAEDFPVSR
jgi:hypothetical protein